LRYAIFGDETTLPGMQAAIGSAVALTVVASNRPQAVAAFGRRGSVQPARSSAERPDFLALLRASKPDVILCFSYSMILDKEMLEIPTLCAINIHGGLLPRYRGANVLNWALIEGAEVTGLTAHHMTTGIDEGDIIYQDTTQIRENDTALTVKHRLDALGMGMISRIDTELRAGRDLPRRPQDPTQARYYRRRRPEDGRIDWSASDREIFNLIRALVKPWPGAYCETSNGERIVLDRYHTPEEVAALRRRYGG